MDNIAIRKNDGYYTIYNKSYNACKDNHAHTKTYRGAKILRDCIKRKEIPKSKRLRESALRITIDREYKERLVSCS